MDRERRIYGNRIFDGEEYFFLFVGKLIRLLIGYILEGGDCKNFYWRR